MSNASLALRLYLSRHASLRDILSFFLCLIASSILLFPTLHIFSPVGRLVLGIELCFCGIAGMRMAYPSGKESSWLFKLILVTGDGVVMMLSGTGSLYEWDGGGRSGGIVHVIAGMMLSVGCRYGYGMEKRSRIGVIIGVGMAVVGSIMGELEWWEVGMVGFLGLMIERKRGGLSQLGIWRQRFAVVATLWFCMLFLEGVRMCLKLVRKRAYPFTEGLPIGSGFTAMVLREILALVITIPAWAYGISVLGLVRAPRTWGLGFEGWFVLFVSNLLPVLLSHFSPVIALGIGGAAVMLLTAAVEGKTHAISHNLI